MRIARGCRVGVDVVLRLDDGFVVDASSPDAPLEYVHGAGEIDAGLEQALEGLAEGERREVVLEPEPGEVDDPLAGRTLRLEVTVREVRAPSEGAPAPA